MIKLKVVSLLVSATLGLGQNVTETGTLPSFSATPASTSVPSASSSPEELVPGQDNYPVVQAWCQDGMNATYCPGPLMQDVQLSQIFPDSKTFADKPTNGTRNETTAAFEALGDNITVAQLIQFVEDNFRGEGLELEQIPIEGFNPDPAILDDISDPIYKAWVSIVNSYWTLLIRQTNESAVCQPDECDSSLIPLNNTIVVPGGRYREIYYWDSYWVLQGLLKSELYDYATDLIRNFMDFIRVYGFIPNGGRKYYLNRSQPPMFVQMLNLYVQETGNTTILSEALPLADIEMKWWGSNRSIEVTSPWTNETYTVYHYNVFVNTAPRPEGYLEDYETANEASPALNETEKEKLYIELASGAESGWDYSVRWATERIIDLESQFPILRKLGVVATIPVDLTSLMRGNHALLANLYQVWGNETQSNATNSNATTQSEYHQAVADNLTAAALDLHWDPEKAWFYDYNITSENRTDIFGPHGTFALWQNITPPELYNNETLGLQMVSGWRYLLGKYAGIPSPATLIAAGLNWDFPNAWPPHAYTSIKAFEAIGRAIGNASTVTANNITVEFDDVVPGQFGLNETELPPQPEETIGNLTAMTDIAVGLPWPKALAVEWANRYMQAAFCSWYSTGGEIEGILTQLPLSDLNATGTYEGGSAGVMFEKFNMTDPDAAGGGGEYEVVVGFGWTNGVVLYLAGEYGNYLAPVSCPLIPIIEIDYEGRNGTSSNGTGSGNGTVTGSGNGTMEDGGEGGVQNGTRAKIFAGYRIPRQ